MGLAIADVSGKGVPAALFMMSSRTLLKGTAIGGGSPAEVVAQVNDLLYEQNEAAMFVTVLYAVYDPERSELTYSCAGHDPPLVVHPRWKLDFAAVDRAGSPSASCPSSTSARIPSPSRRVIPSYCIPMASPRP